VFAARLELARVPVRLALGNANSRTLVAWQREFAHAWRLATRIRINTRASDARTARAELLRDARGRAKAETASAMREPGREGGREGAFIPRGGRSICAGRWLRVAL